MDVPVDCNDDSVSVTVENSMSVDAIGGDNAEPVANNTVSDKQSETGVAECELSDTASASREAEVVEM